MRPINLIILFFSLTTVLIACSSATEGSTSSNNSSSSTAPSSVDETDTKVLTKAEIDKREEAHNAQLKANLEVPSVAAGKAVSPAKPKKGEAVKVNKVTNTPKEKKKPIKAKTETVVHTPKTDTPIDKTASTKDKVDELPTEETSSTTGTEIAPKVETPPPPPKPTITTVDHRPWDQLLKKHVSSSGKVNYKGFKADMTSFKAYLKSISDNPVKNDWSRNEQMAYWINAYNAFTIKLIVDNYPVKKITDLEGGKPWDKKWIKIGDKTYSLNNIENDILRPKYKEPGIHFAVNCAAKSCPPILNRAWTAKNLNANFKKQAIAFINNNAFNEISTSSVKLSKIFDWYKSDFGDLISYLNKYAKQEIKATAKIAYKEYDWTLNE